MTAKENIGAMLNYIRFSTRKGENKTLIEIRTGKDCRLDAVIESVSYPFFECAYSLTAEHGEEWLLRIEDLHMEAFPERQPNEPVWQSGRPSGRSPPVP